MSEEILNFDYISEESSIIKVIGVGGGGNNAVNHMFDQGIKDVTFVVCNTDAQALRRSKVPIKIQLGTHLTEGRGAGNKPEQGKKAALESVNEIKKVLQDKTKMVFITAGMGGGTGTGAAPIIAKLAKEDLNILTVAIVTIPFHNEGPLRKKQAVEGINELKQYCDAMIIICNEKLREIYGNSTMSGAFKMADNVLTTAAKGIAEIITLDGHVNVDFEDVKTVMANSGVAIMGSGSAEGENRALRAIEDALNSPLLNNNNIKGAKNILVNITSGKEEMMIDEFTEITDYILREVGSEMESNMIWGCCQDDSLDAKINVTIIATGFDTNSVPELFSIANMPTKKVEIAPLIEPENTKVEQATIEFKTEEVTREPEVETVAETQEKEEDIQIVVSAENENPMFKIKTEPVYKTTENSTVVSNAKQIDYAGKDESIQFKVMPKTSEDIDALNSAIPEVNNYDKIRDLSPNELDKIENIPAYERLNKKHSEPAPDEISEKTISTTDKFPSISSDNVNINVIAD